MDQKIDPRIAFEKSAYQNAGSQNTVQVKMTEEQEEHLQRLNLFTSKLTAEKYRKGQAEHGGDLFRKPDAWLLDQAILEAIDQVVYLQTLRERLFGTML